MKHNIDRILEACDKAIADSEAAALKTHEDQLTKLKGSKNAAIKKRSEAALRFQEIAEVLATGSHLNERDKQFISNLQYYSSSNKAVRLDDLTHDYTKEPEAPKKSAAAWLYDLKAILTNLKRDNDGTTTVSTSFLKDLGYGNDVIRWVSRI